MGARNLTLGLVFLMVVLAFTVFAAKRLLFRAPANSGVAALLEKAKLPAKPPQPKPSAAVPPPAATAPSSSAPSSASAAPLPANARPQVSTPAAGGAVATLKNEPSPAATGAAPAIADHHSLDLRPQLRLESGARLWIHVTAISRKPDGSFAFRGALLQPVELANANRLDQGTELSGSGTVNNGHVTVLVKDFTIGGVNFALLQRDASGSNKRPGAGLAVELDPGKLLEVWIASSSVYRRAP